MFEEKCLQLEEWGKPINDEVCGSASMLPAERVFRVQQRAKCLLATQRGEFLVKYAANKLVFGT